MSAATENVGIFSNQVSRSDCTISGPAIFCTSVPTRRAGTKIAGTMETSIHSRSSWIQLQALPLYDSRVMMTPSVSTIKASDNIPFTKNPLDNYFNTDPNTNIIRTVNQRGPTEPWKKALPISVAKAVRGSNFSVIRDPTNKLVSRMYYQHPALHLKECYYNHLGTRGPWVFGEQVPQICLSMNRHPSHLGDFDPGVQPRGTPITAEVVQDGDVDINVIWRDARGRVASGSWSKSSGWDLPDPNGGREQLDGRD